MRQVFRRLSSSLTLTMVVACCAFSTLAPLPVQLMAEDSGQPAEETDERESQEEEEAESTDPLERRRRRRFRFSTATLSGIELATLIVSGHRPTAAVHVGHSLANGLNAPLIC